MSMSDDANMIALAVANRLVMIDDFKGKRIINVCGQCVATIKDPYAAGRRFVEIRDNTAALIAEELVAVMRSQEPTP